MHVHDVSPGSVAILGTRGYPSYYGGFETAVRKLAPYLVRSGWDVTVYGRRGATLDDDPSRDASVRTVITKGIESKSLSTLSYGLTASIHTIFQRPDVALIMNVANGYFLPLLKLRGIRTVVNVDGIEWDRAKWGKTARLVFKIGALFTARYADQLVFDSLEIKNRWQKEFRRSGVYIPYGGEVVPNLPLEQGLKHRQYVLFVARFVEENTISEFLEAAPIIAKVLPVVIVGSSGYGGELEERVRRLADSTEQISWLGHISDDNRLHSLWQHAAVYFHGHSVGGTNPTLVQAMTTKTPIVARDTPYNREVLPEDAPFFLPNVDSISKTVLSVVSDKSKQEKFANDNFTRARNYFSWKTVCQTYAQQLQIAREGKQRKY